MANHRWSCGPKPFGEGSQIAWLGFCDLCLKLSALTLYEKHSKDYRRAKHHSQDGFGQYHGLYIRPLEWRAKVFPFGYAIFGHRSADIVGSAPELLIGGRRKWPAPRDPSDRSPAPILVQTEQIGAYLSTL
jgi:hypothetical protein